MRKFTACSAAAMAAAVLLLLGSSLLFRLPDWAVRAAGAAALVSLPLSVYGAVRLHLRKH